MIAIVAAKDGCPAQCHSEKRQDDFLKFTVANNESTG
jgi:hypothetical protein